VSVGPIRPTRSDLGRAGRPAPLTKRGLLDSPGNFRFATALFPDGHICQTCLRAALRDRGACPGCGRDRPLIGRLGDGTAACRECAGITREFTCRHCGYEGEWCIARICLFCRNARKLDALLDDGSGRPRAELKPLTDYLRAELNPMRVEEWLNLPGTRALLADLATGRLALSHHALASFPDWRKAAYMRDLLVASAVLPAIDKRLTSFESWLNRHLASLADHPQVRLLREFGTWHQLSRMRAAAAGGPLAATACKYAQDRFLAAVTFLNWMTARGLRPADVAQADIDAFYISHKTYQQQAVRAFLTWAIKTGHLPSADVPVTRFTRGSGFTQHERYTLIKRFATSTSLPLYQRVAACLLLLYAIPLSRIVRLTPGDIIREDGEARLRLGTPPAPVPEPFASMLDQLAAESAGTGWLFPGRNPGQPRDYRTVSQSLRAAGLPMRAARATALRQLVVQAPAPVVTDGLGFHQNTTARHVASAGGTWNRHAASRLPGSRREGKP
jgi:hypothetical protein